MKERNSITIKNLKKEKYMKKKILTIGMVLALVAVLVVPMAALAADTDVSGTIAGELTLTPPAAVTLPSLTIAGSPHDANDTTGNVYTTAPYTLTVADADQAKAPGYLIASATTAVTATGVGSTTTIVASALTGADDYWNGWSVIALTGTAGNIGEVQTVTDWVLGTTTLTTTAFTSPTASSDTFTLFMPLTNSMLFATAATADLTISGYETELQGLAGHGVAGTFAIPLYVRQARVAGDDVADTYSLTLTYTATP